VSESKLSNERTVVVGAAIALAVFLIFTELVPNAGRKGPAGFAPGRTVPVRITLVTADAFDLGCASDAQVGEARCAFTKEGAPAVSANQDRGVMAPYMTANHTLLLIPDLWLEPAIAQRLSDEPPQGKPRDQLKRFIASCDLRIERKVNDLFVRWQPTAAWSPRDGAWAGTVSGCKIE